MKNWRKELEYYSFVVTDTEELDEQLKVVKVDKVVELCELAEKEGSQEYRDILTSVVESLKEEGIKTFYSNKHGMIVVDDIDNLLK